MKIYNSDSSVLLDVIVDDNSYRTRTIQGDHNVVLYFAQAEHVEIPVGAYIEFQKERYTLERPEALKMQHSRNFEYTITFESAQAKAKVWKFRNPVDGRLKFNLTAKPIEHLQMFIDNMNRRDSGWVVGECIDGTETLISYDHAYCLDALTQMSETFNTEYEISGKTVSLRKVEYNKSNPLSLSYGRGNGFKSGIGRSNHGDIPPVEILFAQGGTENIDRSKYGASELLLPKSQSIGYDGEHFDTDAAFDATAARHYVVDDDGLSIRRSDKALSSLVEDSLDCAEYYPKRIGEVSFVSCEDETNHYWDIADNAISDALNYNDYQLDGETMSVTFQSGMLAGKTFEVTYHHDSVTESSVTKEARRFELVPAEVDGITMPDKASGFYPQVGDTYAIFGCTLPDAYICDNDTKTGASWDMLRACVRYLYDNEDTRFSFTGEIDGIWAKKNWDTIGGKIVLGGYVRFTDARFQQEPILVRITTIKEYINKQHSPEIELSNSTQSSGVSSTLKQLASQEVLVEDLHTQAVQFTKRRYRDAKETMQALNKALLDEFTNAVTPISVQTMQMVVGDESLQFYFVDSLYSSTQVADTIVYDQEQKMLSIDASYIQHQTYGISDISSSHTGQMSWYLPAFASAHLDDGSVKYYLYAKVSRTTTDGEFVLSQTAHRMGEESQYLWLLVGILNSEADGERSFAPLYGFTEILPSRVTTDRIASGNGSSYFDMLNNAMKLGDALQFNVSGDGLLKLRGTLVQSQGGTESTLGCYRGVYNATYTYYNGDEVTYTASNGCTSLYRQIGEIATKDIDPEDEIYWQVIAQGAQGQPGISPNTAYKSTVFVRATSQPAKPTGGSYAQPVPSGWSDGVPAGDNILWASTRIFSSDGEDPQQAEWTTPQQLTDTSTLEVVFSSSESPANPSGHPNVNPEWSGTADETTIWMSVSQETNGVWGAWQTSRIKGEKGQDGTSIKIVGKCYGHFASIDAWTPDKDNAPLVLIDSIEDMSQDEGVAYNVVKRYNTSTAQWVTSYAATGDSYTMSSSDTTNGHLFTTSATGWIDAGAVKGEKGSDGKNAYMHIKFAKSLTKDDWSDNYGETPSAYIGVYCDNTAADQLVWDLYSWTQWKGEDGFGYEYIYKRTTSATAPSTPTETSQETGFVPSGWNADPIDVSATYLYCWVCYRKKTDGVWGAFIGSALDNTKAALWAKYGQQGEQGTPGEDGDYYEYRYAVNGSPTTAPSIDTSVIAPSGWSTLMPTVGSAQYLWMTVARKSGDGAALVDAWATPVRMTAKDGTPGTNGKSPAMVYRGIYNAASTYYGNDVRLDCVKYGDTYYICRIDAGTITGIVPTSTDKWNAFGASFESVATDLLLAENASIGNWRISSGNIVSTLDSGNVGKVTLDAKNGKIQVYAPTSQGKWSETATGVNIKMDAADGIVSVRDEANNVSEVSAKGVFANFAGSWCASGGGQLAAIVGLGNGNLDKSSLTNTRFVAGVYGDATNTGTAPCYGGYFRMLKAAGLVLNVKTITDTDTSVQLTDYQTYIIGFSTGSADVYLPQATRDGQTVFIKQWQSGKLVVYAPDGYKLYNDSTADDRVTLSSGEMAICVYILAKINGTSTGCWLINRLPYN